MKYLLAILFVLFFIHKSVSQDDIITITNLPFNTSMFNEFSPFMLGEGMCFTSNRAHPFLRSMKDDNGERLYNIYFVYAKDSIRWRIPRLFSRDFTSPFNEGHLTSNKNLTQVIFSRNNVTDTNCVNKYYFKSNPVGLFISEKADNKWCEPVKLPFIKEEINYLHPFWYNDSILFFTSDLPGGMGGTDIYYSVFKNNSWSEPINAGNTVNTSYNENFPFYSSENRLYFSSDRAESLGGYDIFYSGFSDEMKTRAVPLPAPLNSKFNDFSYTYNPADESGYFSSDRNGSDDIFHFKMNWPSFNQCDSIMANNYCFTFFEKGNYDLDTMPLRYEWDIAGIKKVRNNEAVHCFEGPGLYIISLNIIDTLTQEIFYNQATYNFVIEDIEQIYIDMPDTSLLSASVHFDGSSTKLKNTEINEFYWEFGDGNRATGKTADHRYEKPGNYNVILGIKGNNLNSGPFITCAHKKLFISETVKTDSAKLIVYNDSSLLVSNPDIVTEKPVLKEFGKNNDIIEDKVYKVEVTRSAEKISLEDEYFDAVREIYTIMENYVSGDSSYSYTVGNETNILNTFPVYMKIKKLGYAEVQVKSFNIVPDSITVSDTLAKILLNNLLSQWKSIHFDYNQFTISPESFDMLDKVFNVLNKYETLIIEIAAHTDDVGTNEYNRELSEKRAQAVTDYLISKGIEKSRMIPKGYGKSVPVNLKRTEEARAENRRVEFIVLKTGMN